MTTRTRPGRRTWITTAAAAGLLALGASISATGGYGLWDSSSTVTGATITSGDLDIRLGDAEWESCLVNPTRPEPAYLHETDLRDGAVFRQWFDMTLDAGGNANLDGDLVITPDPVTLPHGATASYSVIDGAGTARVSDAGISDPTRIPLNTGGTDPETLTGLTGWRIEVTITQADAPGADDLPVNVTADPLTGDISPTQVRVADFTLTLEQTR